jgi:cell division protein FtsQ
MEDQPIPNLPTPRGRLAFLRARSFWISALVIGLAVLVMVFSFSRKKELVCQGVEISIDSIPGGRFIHPADVEVLLQKAGFDLVGTRILDIDIAGIEALVQQIPAVKNVEVVSDADGIISLEIAHRIPILRVINQSAESYYIDMDGRMLRLSDRYTADVPLSNGRIRSGFLPKLVLTDSAMVEEKKDWLLLRDLYHLAMFIHTSELWNAQIEQIFVEDNGDICLVPRLGKQTILLGNADDVESKFDRLRALYLEGFSKLGWDTFTTINLKFKDQVVCATSALPILPVVPVADSLKAKVADSAPTRDSGSASKKEKVASTSPGSGKDKKPTEKVSKKGNVQKTPGTNDAGKPKQKKEKTIRNS